jgi:hypothetical protein
MSKQALEADALQSPDQLIEIVVELRADVGVQRRGADALVEADRGQQVGGHREVGTGHLLLHDLRRGLLVGRVGEGVHEADRHRRNIFLLEEGDGLAHLVEVERRHFAAGAIEAALDAGAQVARHQWLDVGVAVVVLLLADAAAHLQRVAHAFGGEQGRFGAGMRQRGVGGDGGAVDDGVDGRGEGFQRQRRVLRRGDVGEAVHDGDGGVGRGGQRFEDRRLLAVAGDDEVGEGAADVDSDFECHGLGSVSYAVVSRATMRRTSSLRILPSAVFGSWPTKTTSRGCL